MDSRRMSVTTTASLPYDVTTPYDEDSRNVFDDQYAESHAGSIEEPRGVHSDAAFLSPFGDDAAFDEDVVDFRPPSPTSQGLQPRNSIVKPSRRSIPVASTETGNALYRSASSASAFTTARSEANDESGPSHPYGMYPQGLGISRSGSVTTISSFRNNTHQGPAHPYAMYPQDISSDGTESESASHIPLGFSGLEQISRRHFNGDGEEEDIIGADGHVEQLPPYTRFDDNGAKIAAGMFSPTLGVPLVGEAVPQSMTDATNISRGQPGSGNATEPLDIEGAPKAWRDMSFREWWNLPGKTKRKKRFCGISFGILLIIAAAVTMVILICGGVIGSFMKKQRKDFAHGRGLPPPPLQPAVTTTITSLIDASALPSQTTSSVPLLPTGSFVVDFGYPEESKTLCLGNNTQFPAWDCTLPGQDMDLTINGTSMSLVSLGNGTVNYGPQPLVLPSQSLEEVIDQRSPSSGVAYHFQTTYSKLVIVAETSLSKRDAASEVLGRPVHPGDKPWFCYWNNTFIEGFIYAQTSSNSTTASSSHSTAATTSGATALSKRQGWGSHPLSSLPITESSCTADTSIRNFNVYAGYSASLIPISSTTVSSMPTSATPTSLTPVLSTSPSPPPVPSSSTLPPSSSVAVAAATPTGYPRLIKLQEARINNQQPAGYCVKMQLLDNGQFVPVVDAGNNPITIRLNESDPVSGPSKRSNLVTGLYERDTPLDDGCFCQWSVGP